ncbi:MAG: HPF/RaiA family ribosome-associated protein [Patescibacteria group bacterium]
MKIIITTKNLELTEDFKDFIEEKIGSLEKFIKPFEKENGFEKGKDAVEFLVEAEKETKHHKNGQIFKIKAKANLQGKLLIASSKNNDLSRALIEVKDELQQEIKKYKLKKKDLAIRKQRKIRNKI